MEPIVLAAKIFLSVVFGSMVLVFLLRSVLRTIYEERLRYIAGMKKIITNRESNDSV